MTMMTAQFPLEIRLAQAIAARTWPHSSVASGWGSHGFRRMIVLPRSEATRKEMAPPGALKRMLGPNKENKERSADAYPPMPPTRQLNRTPPKQRSRTPPRENESMAASLPPTRMLPRTPPKQSPMQSDLSPTPQEQRFTPAPPPLAALIPDSHTPQSISQQTPPRQQEPPAPSPAATTLVVPAEAWLAMQAQLTALQTSQNDVKQYLKATLRLEHRRREHGAIRLQAAWRARLARATHPIVRVLHRRQAYRAREASVNISRVHLTVPAAAVYATDRLRPIALAVVDAQRLCRGFLVRRRLVRWHTHALNAALLQAAARGMRTRRRCATARLAARVARLEAMLAEERHRRKSQETFLRHLGKAVIALQPPRDQPPVAARAKGAHPAPDVPAQRDAAASSAPVVMVDLSAPLAEQPAPPLAPRGGSENAAASVLLSPTAYVL